MRWPGRAARGWSQLALEATLLLVLLGSLQVLAERTNRRIDLTAERALSLLPVTRKVLHEVVEPMRITVFHRRGDRAAYARLLAKVRDANPRVEVALYDIDRYPERARALGVTGAGRAAIEYGGRRRVVAALPEESLAGGILAVVRGRARGLVLTRGHGERPPGGDGDGLGRLLGALDAENYRIDVVSLLDGPLPPETEVVVVAGPRRDFLPPEVERLAAHLRAGGGVVLLLDPGPLPELSAFLGGLGIRLGDDMIAERDRRVLGTEGLAAVVEEFRQGNPISHPPANPIESGVVLPSARSVDVVAERPGIRAESIARTGAGAWAMRDVDRARRGVEPSRAAGDSPGPLSVIVIAELLPAGTAQRGGRLVVVGDSDFATDAYLEVLGNRDVVLNAIAWAAGEEALSADRPAPVPEIQRPLSPLVLTERQARWLLVGVAVVQPAAVAALGAFVLWRRRRRG